MRTAARTPVVVVLIAVLWVSTGCWTSPGAGSGTGDPTGEGASVIKTDTATGGDAIVVTPAGDLEDSFIAFCLATGTSAAGGDTSALGTLTVTDIRIVQDSTGRWWGSGVVTPSTAGQENLWVWGSWDGASWSGRDAGGDEPSVFFPADVVSAL